MRTPPTFPPLKESCLRAMLRGPLQWTPEGWVSTAGVEGIWNSHTIGWLAWRGYVRFVPKGTATIRGAGRNFLQTGDRAA